MNSAYVSMRRHEAVREKIKVAGAIAVLVGALALVGTVDYEEEVRLDALRQQRDAQVAAGACLPKPGQETRWTWQPDEAGGAGRLACSVYEPVGKSGALRLVSTTAPAGMDRLALAQEGGR